MRAQVVFTVFPIVEVANANVDKHGIISISYFPIVIRLFSDKGAYINYSFICIEVSNPHDIVVENQLHSLFHL